MTVVDKAPLPKTPRRIAIIGAGGIVNDAHLPAYNLAGFEVVAITDIKQEQAEKTAKAFGIPNVYSSSEELIKALPEDAVVDLAVPASKILEILPLLKEGTAVLIQKPMGENLQQAEAILKICTENKLKAAVNFQLRYAPFIIAARHMIDQGLIGELHDIDIRVNVYTPWHFWDFLFELPRVEILYHSIHYIDVIRSFLGNPEKVFAKTTQHPKMKELEATRTSLIMDYGDEVRANINTNHGHEFGEDHQESFIKFEGSEGAIKIKMGLLMNYPEGVADTLHCILGTKDSEAKWEERKIEGSWFPEAFIGSMSSLMCYLEDPSNEPGHLVKNAFQTMAVVEAAYESSQHGGEKPKYQ